MSYYSSRYRRTVSCKWGELFGLEPADLTDDQLKQITTDKLVELLGQDPRVEILLGDRLLTDDIKNLKEMRRLEKPEVKGAPYLYQKYNDAISFRAAEIDTASKESGYYRNQRSEYVYWGFLNESNRGREIARWLDAEYNVVEPQSIDYGWLFSKYEWLGHQTVKKILGDERTSLSRNNKDASKAAQRVIAALNPDQLSLHIKDIFACNKAVHAHALSNPHLPSKYVIQGLRSIAGRKRLPSINIKLTKQQLEALPSVMRLEVLESIMVHAYGRVEFDDILDEEQMRLLLFSCTIKHLDRVAAVLQRFNVQLKRKKAQADKGE